ncbi:PEP-CTERM sorting domain-containing protein [Aquincola tertiaricarbonis]|uniref:PEP-CTERM sorting domain-containing protein n=1 Tax=Aquincola tertiaricarbonis TaxID=391953 RepID=A0ABY4S0M3_AQUTE|nr:PEP-CTERM sorting domain-containing protein [Aquincola tertiaricarbonis]URI06502.1 PEP-CTERM sorting domain-containing protein [Aquincola tertiaricarbonis]
MKRQAKQPVPSLSLIALTVAALCQPAAAADYIWQGGDGQWLDASKWTLLGVPGAGDTATINFTSTGSVDLHDTRSLDRLTMNGGRLGGNGTLNLGSLVFNGGALGATSFGSGGTINVSDATTFNGNGAQDVALSQRLNLNGNSTWTAGNGRLAVDGAYSAGNTSYPGALLRIGTGTTFTDEGAASSNGYKVLGGGDYTVINEGTYQRNGLGTTWARGLDNRGVLNVQSGIFAVESGNWLSTSSGQVNVAQGAELWLANTTFTGGSINNAGKVMVIGNDSHVQAAASISGQWQIDRGRLFVQGQQRIGAFTLNGGDLTGQGTLTVDSLEFNAGKVTNPSFLTGLRLDVQGTARFDGSNLLRIESSAQLQLNGNSTWTAGNGRLAVDGAYSAGNTSYPSALLRIGTGTTFTDEGAASSNGYKVLGGGTATVVNNGTYIRSGLGTTEAYGLSNAGLLDLTEGALAVDSTLVNTGTLNIRTGTMLQGLSGSIRNDGLLQGDGTVRTVDLRHALVNAGTLTPGSLGSAGQLQVDGDLTLLGAGALRIDLAANAHDLVNITSDMRLGGTLQIWASPTLELHTGDSFVVATYGQRLDGSTFDQVLWLGQGGNPFSVEYGDHALTLRVTAAVPEPSIAMMLLLGLGVAVPVVRRRR